MSRGLGDVYKRQSQNRTTNQTTNEHKHPNQYTKGADDEGAKNKK